MAAHTKRTRALMPTVGLGVPPEAWRSGREFGLGAVAVLPRGRLVRGLRRPSPTALSFPRPSRQTLIRVALHRARLRSSWKGGRACCSQALVH